MSKGRWRASGVAFVIAMAGSATAHADGIRLGPVETLCADAPGAETGDVALVNVTVVQASAPGFVTAHNQDTNPYGVSSVNTLGDDAIPNLTATVVTDDSEICITSSLSMSSHVVLDLVGMIDGAAFRPESGGARRLLDTRRTAGRVPLAPDASVCVSVPGANAGDVAFVNATVTEPDGLGYLTVHDSSNANPTATSSLNFARGDTRANLTMTVLSADGRVCATASTWSSTHVILDVVGILDGDQFEPVGLAPFRVLDSRRPTGPTGGAPIAATASVCVTTPGAGAGDGVIANVAITEPDGIGYATVHRPGAAPKATSTHNFAAGQTIANLTATAVAAAGQICVTPSDLSAAHVVIDLMGSISADVFSAPDTGATRLLDTRLVRELPGRYGPAALRFASCDELLDHLKTARLAELDRYETLFGDGGFLPLPQTNGNPPASVPDFSTTNTQVAAVDEGDVVETDGRYLYDATQRDGTDGEIRIIDIAAARQVASIPLVGPYPEIILHDGRILATTRGADFDFTQTNVTKIDVSDPQNPVVLDRYGLDGTRRTMRSVDGNVHTVLRSDRTPDGYDYWWGADIEASRAAVESSTIEDWLPRVFPILPDNTYGEPELAADCTDFGLPNVDAGTGFTWVAQDDLMSGPGLDHATGVIADAGQVEVMASVRNLYVAVTSYVGWDGGFLPGEQITGIHLFEMNGSKPTAYRASTELPGRLLNQFAMGEFGGVLRVAVTDGWWDSSESAVFALRPVGSTFERMSVVSGLGFGEQIFAVRHLGDISYVVTFRQTDPLYVVDFTDPLRPRVAGELKIPGFSDYLHPVADGLLVGVGQDADPTGATLGAQVSLFDVRDSSAPRQIDTEFVGGWNRLFDHREFLFWPPSGAIAFPARYDDGTETMSVTRLDDRRLRTVGAVPICNPQRSVVVGDELIVVGGRSIVFTDLRTLAVRAALGTCVAAPGS